MRRAHHAVGLALVGVLLPLLLVGLASGTILRHLLQVLPVGLALVPVLRRRSWGPCAAVPLFLFWLLIMLTIWLWLLGLARITSGHFTPAEVVLTVIIAVSCIGGLVGAVRCRPTPRLWAGIAVFLLFAALQIGAMWLSLQEPVARR
jgi:hypothetical protein